MIRKLKNGQYRIYSRKIDEKTGKRRNLGTFATREQAEKHERDIMPGKFAASFATTDSYLSPSYSPSGIIELADVV
jgi:hypothetical protein